MNTMNQSGFDSLVDKQSNLLSACCTLDISGNEQLRLVGMFNALSNPIRFEILKFLLMHPNCITKDIVEAMPISQSTVSQHIKVLREAGWITSEAKCQATCHWLDEDNIAWFKGKVREIF